MTPIPLSALIEELFALFGGPTKLAESLSTIKEPVATQTVHSWKTNKNGIPKWRRPQIVRDALKRNVQLTPNVLTYLDPDGTAVTDTIATGETLGTAGMAAATAHVERVRAGWSKDASSYLVRYLASSPAEFLGEDLKKWAYDQGLDAPVNESAWGTVMRRAAKEKLIEMIGFAKSKSATRHGTPSRLWRKR